MLYENTKTVHSPFRHQRIMFVSDVMGSVLKDCMKRVMLPNVVVVQ